MKSGRSISQFFSLYLFIVNSRLKQLLKFKYLIFILLFSGNLNICAQTKKITLVDFDIASRSFTQTLPFDEPFLIKGKADTDVKKIIFNYRIKEDTTRMKWYYFPDKAKTIQDSVTNNGYLIKEITWERISNSDTYFILPVGPIHPNLTYEFKFQFIRSVTLEESKQKELKTTMLNELNNVFKNPNTITYEKIKILTSKLNNIIKSFLLPSNQPVNIKNQNISSAPFDSILKPISDRIWDLNKKIIDEKTNIDNIQNGCLTDFHSFIDTTLPTINKLLKSQIKLSPDTKVCFNCPLNPMIAGFSSYTINDLISILRDTCNNINYFEQLIKGSGKLSGKSIEQTDHFDFASARLIISFFYYLRNCSIKDSKGKYVFSKDSRILESLSNLLDILIQNNDSLKKADEDLAQIKNDFPDIFSTILVRQTCIIEDQSEADVESKETPYIGIDGGIVYAPVQASVYGYYGMNIYLKPVNKRTPFSSLKGWDLFTKIFSLYFGFATELTTTPNSQDSYLIGSNTNLLLGFGFRINRMIRFNLGAMIYQRENENPVVNKKYTVLTPTISCSIDINIIKGFEKFGTILKLN
jgi:hypothetical protein